MIQTAKVTRVLDNGTAEVAAKRQSACGHDCSKCGGGCSELMVSSTVSVVASNPVRAMPGDMVRVESSTGGVLMPPVMGAVAFIMASFLNTSYSTVIVAAAIPALLYYFSLVIQVDFYAARNDLYGLPQAELPKLKETLKDGWWYLVALILLIFLMLFSSVELHAPYYISILLLVVAQIKKKTRFKKSTWVELVWENAKILSEMATILAAVGFIVGTLSMTGMAQAFSAELLFMAGGQPFLLLLLGALACFILGFGMTVSAAYIFIAIVLVPALTTVGFEPMAVHLFVMYWGMLSYITPPVCLACFTAGSIAHTSPVKTGFTAMRLGCIIYFLPFFFVYNPELILMGDSILGTLWTIFTAIIGIIFIAAGLQGYMFGYGKLERGKGLLMRLLFICIGVLLIVPEPVTDLIGIVCAAAVLVVGIVLSRRRPLEV